MRYLTFALITLLVACGGDAGTNPTLPPVQAPRVARVQLASTTVLARTSSKFTATRLVQVAYDKNGAVISNPALWYVAPAGSYMHGDTVFTQATEGVGTLRISYDSLPGVPRGRILTASAAQLDTTAVDTSVTVTVGLDLHPYRWRASWGCASGAYNAAGVYVDSLFYFGTVTPSYNGDSLYTANTYTNAIAIAQLNWQGSVVQYLRTGEVDTIPNLVLPNVATLVRQAPDTMFLHSDTWSGGQWPAVRDPSAVLPRYQSRGWCYTGDGDGRHIGTATFEAF